MRAVDLIDTAGITYRQLDHWTTQGYVRGGNPGSGYQRIYTEREVRVVCAMAQLVHAGLRPEAAATLAQALTDGEPALLGSWRLVPSDALLDEPIPFVLVDLDAQEAS